MTSLIRALGYVGVNTLHLSEWITFGTRVLGLQCTERAGGSAAFRIDERQQRVVVEAGTSGGPGFIGWQVDDAAALGALAARLEAAGVAVSHATRALAQQRAVADLIIFSDPAGNRLEAFHGAVCAADPFTPSRPLAGFVTGELGLGHVVLNVERVDEVLRFYRDVLGFGLSDYVLRPFAGYFLHVNPRHHSLALVGSPKGGMHHLMLELFSLDDVGRAYDAALQEDGRIATTLGRHTNDFMTSFYAFTPSDVMLEYGWGGRRIQPAGWQAEELTGGPSLWGHERHWMPAEGRAEARRLREQLAAAGVRHPVQVLPGNFAVFDQGGKS